MSLSTIMVVIVVALFISAIAATAGYYLQTRLRRLEELEEPLFTEPLPPSPPPVPRVESEEVKPTESLSLPPSLTEASLTIIQGRMQGQKFHLTGRNIRIGREPRLCDIVLGDPAVSRLHARIVLEDNSFHIRDEGSVNGTFVNGERVEPVVKTRLHDGDRITLGKTELEFRLEDSDEELSEG